MNRCVKFIFFGLLLIAIIILIAGCDSPDNGEEASNELRLAHFFPATHPVETELVAEWSSAIEEATDGEVVIDSYPGETLLDADEVYGSVVEGVADLGLSCFAYTRGRFPVLEAFELPGIVYDNSQVASQVAWEGIQELNPEEVQDTKLLMVWATGPGDLLTTKPVETLEDLQDMDIRATGLSARTLEQLGANPSAMPQSDTYDNLNRGVVEGNLSPVEVLEGWNQAEVTDYITLTPFLYNTLFYITMNLDTWNALDEEHQDAIASVSEEFHQEVAVKLWDDMNQSALDFAIEETGQEIIELEEGEASRWMELVEPIQEEYLQEMEEQDLPGDEALDTVKRLAEEYNQ